VAWSHPQCGADHGSGSLIILSSCSCLSFFPVGPDERQAVPILCTSRRAAAIRSSTAWNLLSAAEVSPVQWTGQQDLSLLAITGSSGHAEPVMASPRLGARRPPPRKPPRLHAQCLQRAHGIWLSSGRLSVGRRAGHARDGSKLLTGANRSVSSLRSETGTGGSGTVSGFHAESRCPDWILGQNQAPDGNAPCWIRTSDRLLRRLAVVGLQAPVLTGFIGSGVARCEQKCEQFAGFGPLPCLDIRGCWTWGSRSARAPRSRSAVVSRAR
jgi:hypothetical protein